VVEPYKETTLVVLGAVDGVTYQWSVGGSDYVGLTPTMEFITINERTTVELRELDPSGNVLRKANGQLITKYVRRELRSLDKEDLTAFLDAMETLYRVPANPLKYGDEYRDAFDFVALHNELAGGRECDHAHDGLGFLTIHTALSMQFEQSLQTVDPSVSLPFWDYTIEAARVRAAGDITAFYSSEVFDPDLLGGFPDLDEGEEYVLKEGRWAYLPMSPKSWPGDAASVTNGYGLMRSPWNQNPSPFLSRSSKMYGAEFDKVPSCDMHFDQMQLKDWASFGQKIQYKPHGSMHTVLAGGWGIDYYSLFLEMG
ncbi:unnamed protein product, partial [Discosporangium mesarthrocarpum]